MKTKFLLISIFLTALLASKACKKSENVRDVSSFSSYFETNETSVKTGGIKMIPIKTPKGTFNVWTKRIGNNPKIKVLLLHGGPGGTHEGFECFESFFPKEGIEFIYYDQLASGRSDQPKEESLYDLDRFVDEVEQVRVALQLDKNNFYLLGHSWGGILGMQYALKYQSNLKALIVSNMMASCPKYGTYANEVLAKQMPPEVLKQIRDIERKGDFGNPKYMELLMPNFYKKHVLRLEEWPEPVNRMFQHLNQDLYVSMQGPSEFGVAGKLANWDISAQLKDIKVPTLVIGASHDTMDPKYMEWMSTQFPNGEFLLCPNGSHCAMYDDQQTYFNGLIKFIKRMENQENR